MISQIKKYYTYWPELTLGLIILIELLFRLERGVLLSDDATYAFRSVNLVDFMASGNQTTPWQWFNPLPSWVQLSFHDAPGLFFWLEHTIFKIFGVSSLAAIILPILGGCLSVIMIYLIVRFSSGRFKALIALALLACLHPFIWLHRLALLESVMVPFVLITWYAYLRAEADKRWYWLVGLAGGLALMTKYTALFLALAIVIHLTYKRSKDWHCRYWWEGAAILLMVISPIIMYNFFVYLTRGHFDVQLAAAFGQSTQDWPILTTHINTQVITSLQQIVHSLASLYSWPVLLVSLWAVFRLIHYRPKQKPLSNTAWFTIIAFCSWLVIILLTRSDDRFIATGYIFPLVVISSSLPSHSWKQWLRVEKAYGIILAAVMIFSWLYLINTTYVTRAWGLMNSTYSSSRRESYGLPQIEMMMRQALKDKKPVVVLEDSMTANFDPQQRNNKLYDPQVIPLAENEYEVAPIIIYDRNMNWFPSIWYFYRWSFYKGYNVFNTQQASDLLSDPNGAFASAVQGRPYILLMTTDYSLRDSLKYQSLPSEIIINLEDKSHKSYIFDNYGQPVWEVYTGRF